MLRIAVLLLLFPVVIGCVGSPIHSTFRYNSIQSTIARNNDSLLRMKTGLSQGETLEIMGKPEHSEGYSWGSVWLYRTAMTSGVYGTSDADFTPVVFDQAQTVVGWGRNFFEAQVKRYDVHVSTDNKG